MRTFRRHHRAAAWLAMLVLALASLAPSIGWAFGATPAWLQGEVCVVPEASGAPQGRAAEGGVAQGQGVHLFEHCPFCTLHLDGAVPVAAGTCALDPGPLKQGLPRAFLTAPRTLHAWASAQPRAPPILV